MAASAAEFHRDAFLENIPDLPDSEFLIYGTVRPPTISSCRKSPLLDAKRYPKVYAHPEHADALEAVYAITNEHAKSEPGTLQYYLARDQDVRNFTIDTLPRCHVASCLTARCLNRWDGHCGRVPVFT